MVQVHPTLQSEPLAQLAGGLCAEDLSPNVRRISDDQIEGTVKKRIRFFGLPELLLSSFLGAESEKIRVKDAHLRTLPPRKALTGLLGGASVSLDAIHLRAPGPALGLLIA